ncbi:MAG: sulfate ABC transporter permease subunit CysW [Lentisphaerae bacterium]|nr:sulfate ABC transporter permease subunit CysW [Lentisphaerota bacterium]
MVESRRCTPIPLSRRGPVAATAEGALARRLLIGVAMAFLGLFLLLPLALLGFYALRQGLGVYLAAFAEPDARAAIALTVLTAAIVVPVNTLFGVAAAWCIARFEFRGKGLLITLIDLPFAMSPVIAGLTLVIVFGSRGWLGPWLQAHHLRVVFATPGIVIATLFVTLPFVARELIPLMQAQGSDAEQSALTLGASGWQTFRRVTLPTIRWGLLYGIILTHARAVGEFGAVSVVSGHVRGKTNTLPLHIEVMYNDYQTTAAFALASLLALGAVVTLAVKAVMEWQTARHRALPEGGGSAAPGESAS